MSETEADNKEIAIDESAEVAKEIIDDMLSDTLTKIIKKAHKLNCVAMYHELMKEALKEVLQVYEKPKPATDHSHIVDAFKRDKPAKLSKPDSLVNRKFEI